jgi:16S rRNA (cytosine967-C5)-methyltransferase
LPTSREFAFDILLQVHKGAFADDLLRAMRGESQQDVNLANELVYGVLRYQMQLDFLIAHYAGNTKRLDVEVRIALQLGVYQIRHLDRIPVHAAVATSVDLVKRARKRSAAGFVNAVLRKASKEAVMFPSRAVELSVPEWLIARWEAHHGCAESIARQALRKPEGYTRNGRFMDIGAQAIVPLLGIEAHHRVLDVCAAPGNKTLHIAEYSRHVVACDRTNARIRQVPVDRRVQLDAAAALPFGAVFDRILVDAPCSGTGTLARNPEIKWRVTMEEIQRHAARQVQILTHALAALKPGGRLVYSTCSLEQEENEDVVAHFAHRLQTATYRLPGRDEGDGFYHAVLA